MQDAMKPTVVLENPFNNVVTITQTPLHYRVCTQTFLLSGLSADTPTHQPGCMGVALHRPQSPLARAACSREKSTLGSLCARKGLRDPSPDLLPCLQAAQTTSASEQSPAWASKDGSRTILESQFPKSISLNMENLRFPCYTLVPNPSCISGS